MTRQNRNVNIITMAILGMSLLIGGIGCGKIQIERSHQSFSKAFDESDIIHGMGVPMGTPESLATVALYLSKGQDAEGTHISNFCTGTLIRSDLVLTAAHCIVDLAKNLGVREDLFVKNIAVGFGWTVMSLAKDSSRENIRYARSFVVHPKYEAGSIAHAGQQPMYDIALLKLSEKAPSSARPAYLPLDRMALEKGQLIRLVGFGVLDGQTDQRATHMMEVDVSIDNPDFSLTQFTYSAVDGRGSCRGDSGGPAYYKTGSGLLVVLGITSWGDQQCQQMGAYTSVPFFTDWIKSMAQQL